MVVYFQFVGGLLERAKKKERKKKSAPDSFEPRTLSQQPSPELLCDNIDTRIESRKWNRRVRFWQKSGKSL
jgi:hypothetical protein